MYSGKLVFSQVMDFMPMHIFRRGVDRYQGNYKIKTFSCLDQYLCMAFAQITYRESLRDIEACLRAQQHKLYHMGIKGTIARSTLADANEQRDWRIYADLAYSLIIIARKLYSTEPFAFELEQTAYALDATTIDLCLSMFPWARCGKLHEVNTLDIIPIEPGAFYIMDRGYLDFARLYAVSQNGAFFVIRAKSNLKCRRLYSHPVDRATGLICDQTIMLTGFYQAKDYPDKLRRIKFYDAETNKTLVFPTNNFTLPALTITKLYRCRWQVELFFRWIKQNLRIKTFYGTSENAVKTQIWIAVSVYVLVAIMKKRLDIQAGLYTILQVLSVSAFERIPIIQLFAGSDCNPDLCITDKQLNLFI